MRGPEKDVHRGDKAGGVPFHQPRGKTEEKTAAAHVAPMWFALGAMENMCTISVVAFFKQVW